MDFLCNEPDSFIDPSVIAEKLLRKRGITREEMGLRKTVVFSFIEDMKKLLLNSIAAGITNCLVNCLLRWVSVPKTR